MTWDWEADRIIKINAESAIYPEYTHHASTDASQYKAKSAKTVHIARHKGAALRIMLA